MKHWKVVIVKDTSKKMFGLHGLQTACRGLAGVEVCALFDPNLENIAERMEFLRAKRHYTDLETMLQTEQPDIAILTSRHPADHFEQIKLCAKYGVHIYCEKPLTCDVAENDEIIRIIRQHKIKLCMAHPCRYAQPYVYMKELIDSGVIGEPLTFTARGKCDKRGGGEDLITLGVHILDWLIHLFGEPESVCADIRYEGHPAVLAEVREPSEPVGKVLGDDVHALFRFKNGVSGEFISRKGLYTRPDGNSQMGLTVTGTKGSLAIRFEDGHERVVHLCRFPLPPESGAAFEAMPKQENRFIPDAEPLDYSVMQFKDCPKLRYFPESNRFAFYDLMQAITEDREPVANAGDALIAQEMIQGIYQSHLLGKKIAFPLSDRRHPLT